MYDGASSMLATSSRTAESAGVNRTTALHMNTAGAIATPQITAWITAIARTVTPIRKAFIAHYHGCA